MSVSGGSPQLTSKNLYSFVRQIKPPTAGELRDPITFYRSVRTPKRGPNNEVTTEFNHDITPYHNAWTKVWQSQTSTLNGQNTENFVSHVFLVRNFKGFAPEVRDGIVWDGKLLSIRGTRNLDGDTKRMWLLVLAEQEGLFAEEPRDNMLTPETRDEEPVSTDPLNPIWIV